MLVTASPTTLLDDLLDRIGVKLQLSQTAYDLAVQRYITIAKWLRADGSPLAKYKPDIYSQGSLRIRTTVKPRGRNEFDLDLVCEFQIGPDTFLDPIELLDLVEERLRANDLYKDKVERMNRCIRITYKNDFHMDILPARPNPSGCLYGEHCVAVPDCDADDWKPSNPKGYALWFENAAREAVVKFRRMVEPVPEQQAYEDLATLNRVVQLIKRRRDVSFEKSSVRPPISIVLTTLAAQNYSGHTSVFEAMSVVLSGIVSMIPDMAEGRLKVVNPTNPAEDLSERWEDEPEAYVAFVSWINAFRSEWESLSSQRGIHNIKAVLEKMFGERVTKEVVEEYIKSFDAPRQSEQLAVEKGTGLIVPATSSAATTIPRNTFYGDE